MVGFGTIKVKKRSHQVPVVRVAEQSLSVMAFDKSCSVGRPVWNPRPPISIECLICRDGKRGPPLSWSGPLIRPVEPSYPAGMVAELGEGVTLPPLCRLLRSQFTFVNKCVIVSMSAPMAFPSVPALLY